MAGAPVWAPGIPASASTTVPSSVPATMAVSAAASDSSGVPAPPGCSTKIAPVKPSRLTPRLPHRPNWSSSPSDCGTGSASVRPTSERRSPGTVTNVFSLVPAESVVAATKPPYAGITRTGSDGRWRQPPSQPGQPELPCVLSCVDSSRHPPALAAARARRRVTGHAKPAPVRCERSSYRTGAGVTCPRTRSSWSAVGRPGRRIARALPGIRPCSPRARLSRNSIWALVERISSAAHFASASWTAGSSRSRMLLRSAMGVRSKASRCSPLAGWPVRCIGRRAGWRPWRPCAPRLVPRRSPHPGAREPS